MSDKTDSFGNRMKFYEGYESERRFLPMLPVYARMDGRGFSKFTKKFKRPYDEDMSRAMIETTKALVAATNAKIGYTQSDEISLVWHEEDYDSQIFFNGRVAKMTSILAAMTTVEFYQQAMKFWPDHAIKAKPTFDARVYQLPNRDEAANAVLWRERDATKNAISMAAQAYFSHRELQHKSGSLMQEMLFQKGINFNDYPVFFKRGTFVRRIVVEKEIPPEVLGGIPEHKRPVCPVVRSVIQEMDMPSFNKVTNRVAVIFDGAEPTREIGVIEIPPGAFSEVNATGKEAVRSAALMEARDEALDYIRSIRIDGNLRKEGDSL